MTTANRALVLSGGGAAGGAWMLALGPATIHLVVADEQSLAAIGPDAASAATAQAALDAGAAQARREISTLKAVWHSRAPGSDQSRRSD